MGLGLKTFTGKTGRNGLRLKAQNCLFDIEMGLKGQPEDVMGPRYYFEIYLNFGKKIFCSHAASLKQSVLCFPYVLFYGYIEV